MLSQHMRTNQGVGTRPVRAMLIGPSRSGKTSASLSFPNPLLVSAMHENGARIADNLPFHVSVIECGSFLPPKKGQPANGGPALMDVVQWAVAEVRNKTFRRADGSPVGTIILDSASHFEALLMNDIVAKDATMETRDWGTLLNAWQSLQGLLWSLPCHVVITCLDEVKTSKSGAIIGHGAALKGQIGGLLPSACDITGYTEQEMDGSFVTYICRRGAFTGGTRIVGMANGPYTNFNFSQHIAPHLR